MYFCKELSIQSRPQHHHLLFIGALLKSNTRLRGFLTLSLTLVRSLWCGSSCLLIEEITFRFTSTDLSNIFEWKASIHCEVFLLKAFGCQLFKRGNQNSSFNGNISNASKWWKGSFCASTHNVLCHVMDSQIVVPRCRSIVICSNIQYFGIAFIAGACNSTLPCNMPDKSQFKCMIIWRQSLNLNSREMRTDGG